MGKASPIEAAEDTGIGELAGTVQLFILLFKLYLLYKLFVILCLQHVICCCFFAIFF